MSVPSSSSSPLSGKCAEPSRPSSLETRRQAMKKSSSVILFRWTPVPDLILELVPELVCDLENTSAESFGDDTHRFVGLDPGRILLELASELEQLVSRGGGDIRVGFGGIVR